MSFKISLVLNLRYFLNSKFNPVSYIPDTQRSFFLSILVSVSEAENRIVNSPSEIFQ